MKVQRLSSTDGFIVWDLDAATTSAGVVRLAPKVLQDGAVLLARSTTYAFAFFGLTGHGGASAAINATPDDRDGAIAAFVDEVRPLAESGRLRLAPSLGTTAADLAPLGWNEPDPALTVAGAVAAARVAGPLDWRTAAVVGTGPVVDAATKALVEADATVVDGRFDSPCDLLFVAGKAGCLDHPTAEVVQASVIVPLTPVPVTARALAVLSKAGRVVVPDFLALGAPLLAAAEADANPDPESDPVQQTRQATLALAGEGPGMWLAAALKAEENLASWTKERPFGRPLA